MNARLPPALAAALAPFAPPQSEVHRVLQARERFNDDDWYVYDKNTLQIVRQVGSKCPRPQAMELHHVVVSGMSAKNLGLWRAVEQSRIPAFISRSEAML